MELISVRELFKEKEKFAGKEVTVGGWIEVSEILRPLAS